MDTTTTDLHDTASIASGGRPDRYDVVVVGAGVIGLAHAAEAVDRGLRVLVVERDHRATGASVRNFGHACVTAQSGDMLELALAARERWLRHAHDGRFPAVASGAVAVARSRAELAVLEELAASREPGQVRLLAAPETVDRIGGAGDPTIVGGAFLRDDVRVDPRAAVAGLAALVASRGVTFRWGTAYLGWEDGLVRTSRGTVRADRTIVCVGHDVDQLYPDLAEQHGIRRCGLQMALVEPPTGLSITPAVLTGTSMLRYPAFAETAAATVLRQEITRERPDLVAMDANVMLTQRPDGSLVVGDSHRYDLTLDPFLDEGVSATLLQDVATLLGVGGLRVRQRWMGVYAHAPEPYLVAHPAPGLTVVSVTSGVGMTISHGLAARTWAGLEALPAPV
ncbi:TIGR03364 family FAD-dependent oxidoreductase [Curtobacterium sp. MCBD17_035]|uniref:TIGR03364 family FAD-dependent oxidoreductase n=1 Tax=Curtobacterium sp. MCBD17_035 TaxID=2175673 RepID=UPI0021AC51E9|nr:TIGR03364 family FAD-dependent oxidoreductase [Curtobacterium sp. MCBD17_035]WIB67143.1 TIGR03364 family FAD-dependent oxidoreductase [Curtobacterium sp. MCBD17_035]